MVKMALKGLTKSLLFTRKLPEGFYRIKTPAELLVAHSDKLAEVYRLAGVQKLVYDKYYLPVIQGVAEYAQETPASESHHHSYPGGLLEHILQTAIYSLRARKSYILPAKVGPEKTTREADIYTYCAFVAACMHDIAKPATDQVITLYSSPNAQIGEWNGFSTNMNRVESAKMYTVKFRADREYRNHELASLMIARVVPDCGMDWLRSNPTVLKELLITIANQDEASVIKDIVKRGDQTSVSLALGAQTAPRYGNTRPLQQKMLTAIRKLKDDGEITFNRQGANSWINDGRCWTMAKTLADLIRKQLEDEGHTGVPTDNTRLFDIMVEHGILQANADGKAIWKVQVSHKDWTPKPFSLVCLPKAVVFVDKDTAPDDYEGDVAIVATAVSEKSKNEETATSESEVKAVELAPEKAVKPKSSLRSIFMDDDDDAVEQKQNDSGDKQVSAPKAQVPSLDAKYVPVVPTKKLSDFKEWFESGLVHKTLKINTADSMIHVIEEGLFLVSPIIFKKFGEYTNTDWQSAQREFQRKKLHIKNENEENWFEVRVQGKRNFSTIKGWIVPFERIETGKLDIKKCNPHLRLISQTINP